MNNTLLIVFFLFSSPCFIYSIPDSTYLPEGHSIVIDSIKITGNETTEPFIILREMTFNENDTVDNESLNFNRERIYSLGIFNFVDLTIIDTSEINILLIEVEESWYIYPIPFFNYQQNSFSKSTYGISFLYKNFRGRNETLRSIISLGYDPSFYFMYEIPVVNETYNIDLSYDFQYVDFSNKSDYLEAQYNTEFELKQYFTSITAGKRINKFNAAHLYAGFRYVESPFNEIYGTTASGKNIDQNVFAGFGYTFDTRDLAQFPKNGILTFFTLSHYGIGNEDIEYSLFRLDFREYRNYEEFLTLRWRLNFRNTFGKTVPRYDYSFLGLSEAVRGHVDDVREAKNYLLTSFEGSFPVISEMKIKFKLPLIPENLTSTRLGIHINAFIDSGVSYDEIEQVKLDNFYSGYGVGIIFLFLPYNAYRIEFAFDEYRNFQLNLGTGFAF